MKLITKLLFILTTFCTLAFATPVQTKKFITIADIHFNPFSGCEQLPTPCPLLAELQTSEISSWDSIFKKYISHMQTRYHQDTDYSLLQSFITELTKLTQQQHPTFILILGDFIAHGFPEKFKKYTENNSQDAYQQFTKKTFQYLIYKLNQTAPSLPFYPVLGNNDSYNGNYQVEPHGLFLKETAEIFSSLIKNNKSATEFKNEYPSAGFYAITLNQHQQRLIVLNSVLFSGLHSTSSRKEVAEEQLIWLEKQLNDARQNKQRVLIALHIPLGVDVFLSSKMQTSLMRYFVHPLFFQSEFNKKIISLLQNNADIIVGLLPAHTHHDNFQLITTENKPSIPSIITASISPIYGNNPGLKIFTYQDKPFELLDFDTYTYPLEKSNLWQWQKEYNFNDVYQADCKKCTLADGILNLKNNPLLIKPYEKYFGESLKKESIRNYWCAIYNTDWLSYQRCMKSINQ